MWRTAWLASTTFRSRRCPSTSRHGRVSTNSSLEPVTGDVGLLIASAGFGTSGPFVDGRLDEELGMIDVNCRAVAALSHAFGRRFVDRKGGGIVLISSLVAFQGVPRAANYAATKAYVQSFAEALRLELKPLGVDVIASAPGPIRSGFATRASMTMRLVMSQVRRSPLLDDVALFVLGGSRNSSRHRSCFSRRWGRVRTMGIVMAGMTKPHAIPGGGFSPDGRR